MFTMNTKNVFQDVVNASVRALFDHTKDSILSQYDGRGLVTEYEPDTNNEQLQAMASPGRGVLTLEGQQYAANQLYRDYPVTLRMNKYSSELAYTEEDLHWLKKANAQKRAMRFQSIASSGLDPLMGNINQKMAEFFYLGFGTTIFTGGDAKALLASDHPIRKTGGTQSNILSTEYTLSANSLNLAVDELARFQNPSGIQLKKPRRLALVVPNELESDAYQIIDSLYGPGNANLGLHLTSQPILRRRGMDINVVTLPEITTTYSAYWWLVDLDRAVSRFFLAWGWQPRMAQDTITQNGTHTIDASTLFGITSLGWQWVIGSRGTGGAL